MTFVLISFMTAPSLADWLNISYISNFYSRLDISGVIYLVYWFVLLVIVTVLGTLAQWLLDKNYTQLFRLCFVLFVLANIWSVLVALSLFSEAVYHFINL